MKALVVALVLISSQATFALGTIACANGTSSLKIKVHSPLHTRANAIATITDARGRIAAYQASAKTRDALITAMKSDHGVQFKNVEGKDSLNVRVTSLTDVEVHGRLNADMSCRSE